MDLLYNKTSPSLSLFTLFSASMHRDYLSVPQKGPREPHVVVVALVTDWHSSPAISTLAFRVPMVIKKAVRSPLDTVSLQNFR